MGKSCNGIEQHQRCYKQSVAENSIAFYGFPTKTECNLRMEHMEKNIRHVLLFLL